MRAYVFTDASLKSEAGRFVWLAIDTEKRQNASLKKRFPIPALPTYFVLDPDDEHVMLRWVGGATVPQLHWLLADAMAAGKPSNNSAEAALARADRLYGEGKDAEAAAAYREALGASPANWPRYARTVESLLFALSRTDDHASCARLAIEAFPRLRLTSSAANVAGTGLDEALSLPAQDSTRQGLLVALEADAREVAANKTLSIAADDRSSLYIALLDARKDAADSAGARSVASQWAAFLESEAAKATTSDERAVFDSHRLSAYQELGQPERAIPMLEASERDLPDDYNPPARLAIALNAMNRWDEALAASDRALAKAYGPRKLRILQTRADIHAARGDAAAARHTIEEAIALAESLPDGQRSEATTASLKKRLEKLAVAGR